MTATKSSPPGHCEWAAVAMNQRRPGEEEEENDKREADGS